YYIAFSQRTHDESVRYCKLLIHDTLWEIENQKKTLRRHLPDIRKKVIAAHKRGNNTGLMGEQELCRNVALNLVEIEQSISTLGVIHQDLKDLMISLQGAHFSSVGLSRMISMLSIFKRDIAIPDFKHDSTVSKSSNQHIAGMASAMQAIVAFVQDLTCQETTVEDDVLVEEVLIRLGLTHSDQDRPHVVPISPDFSEESGDQNTLDATQVLDWLQRRQLEPQSQSQNDQESISHLESTPQL
ncbi:hypothetical protein SISSUDRAFT_1038059, partial [Sistotremastrum suecicum HHB10207 ss-3]